jgi:HEAT repeats
MTNCRLFVITGSLLTASALATAQTPPAPPAPPAVALAPAAVPVEAPVPPVPPADVYAPQAAPSPSPVPRPAAVPLPPKPPDWEFQFDNDFQYKFDLENLNIDIEKIKEKAREKAEEAMEKVGKIDLENLKINQFEIEEKAREGAEKAREMAEKAAEIAGRTVPSFDLAFGKAMAMPFAFAPQQPMPSKGRLFGMPEDALYQRGQNALDNRRWEDAVEYFNQAALKNGSRTDGALYWKAYALNRLGRGAEAKTVLADLRAKHPNSRWLDDAKALDLQIAQASGKPVSPEDETSEDMKILAINGIMQSDPERGLPLLEGILKGGASPKIKQRAVYVLAQSSSPKAQALLEQLARGSGNPDLQVRAVQYLGERRRGPATSQMLAEIYAATNDKEVKRAILHSWSSRNEKDRLLAAAKNEKDLDLKRIAIDRLGDSQGNPELWQLYESETTVDGKKMLLDRMHRNTNVDKLLNVARTEKDPEIRRAAIRVLGDQRTTPSADALVQIYTSEQDEQIRRWILDSLSNNDVALIQLARAEKDPKMKLRIVERISNLASRSKAAADYLEELLKQ